MQLKVSVEASQDEVIRLNKVIQVLMDRAERNVNLRDSDFNLFDRAVTLEDQVRYRTARNLKRRCVETRKSPAIHVKANPTSAT
ncbi:hypothetical protein [Synechococcus sp. BA-132 BA5]|uniref:hypothetical protein n=1 Tax=Synechococcus sp. BA-132 BA5 TaxID=3110252 RepID=UPI002B1F895C|nr:hypothetical protein [Synechococcus sp. BA-132 BA5]MEA5416368.1 hypothetical protein [Synechococcus sp. BA-132 BA5]